MDYCGTSLCFAQDISGNSLLLYGGLQSEIMSDFCQFWYSFYLLLL